MSEVAPQASGSSPATCVDLLENEGTAYIYLDGVTTVTFFDGPAPLEQLKSRLVQIVKASPWVAGKLVTSKGRPGESKKGTVQMAFDPAPSEDLILSTLLQETDALELSPTLPYEHLTKALSKSPVKPHVTTGWDILKKGLSYTKVTVARGKSGTSWALIFSVSHVVADGYTYYKLLGMFSGSAPIISLNPVRKPAFLPAVKRAVGEAEYKTVMGAPSLIVNYLSNMLFGKTPRVYAFYVDAEKIEAAKKQHKLKNAGADGTDFVSTNDILTTWWGRLTRARLLEMALNFRGRMTSDPNLVSEDAGNYEFCILFSPQDFQDPSLIRKSLQRKDGRFCSVLDPPRPLPGCWSTMRCRYRIISNWASFFTDIELEGCTQTLHIPYLNPSEMPTDICVIFRPTRDTLGVYVVTRKLKDEVFVTGANGAEALLGKQIMQSAGAK
ncbi:unnamed protein product [Amoebophrya sp. A120]|nr:unnamed protein product [Amoebophrya sp. A120]|eukprot:GSA120T00003198001.1